MRRMASGSENAIPEDRSMIAIPPYSGFRLFDDGGLPRNPSIPSTTLDTGSLHRYNLDELSEQLIRDTEETQRLQDEAERATKHTMERIGHTLTDNSTPPPFGYMPIFLREDQSDTLSSGRQSVIQSLAYSQDDRDLEVARTGGSFYETNMLKNAIKVRSQQVSDLQKQLGEANEQNGQQRFTLEQSITKLQTELLEVQRENKCIIDSRMEESKKQADLRVKMEAMIQELRTTKQSGDHKLLEAKDEAQSLRRKAESMEKNVQEVYCALAAYEKRFAYSSYVSEDVACSYPDSLRVAVEKVLKGLACENRNLQESLVLAKEQLGSLEQKFQGKEEAMRKEQRDRREAESQATVHQNQVSDLELTLTRLRSDLLEAKKMHEVQVGTLEMQLAQIHSQVEEAHRGRDRSLQQAAELDARFCQLRSVLNQAREELSLEKEQNKQLWEQDACQRGTIAVLQRELEERCLELKEMETLMASLKEDYDAQTEAQLCADKELSVLRKDLEHSKDQLQRGRAEELRQQALMEEREAEMEQEQKLRQQEAQQARASLEEAQRTRTSLEEAQGCCQALKAEMEATRLKLEDKEKAMEQLRLQMASATQATAQHAHKLKLLHDEKSRLSHQLNEHRQKIQQLKTDADQHDVRLAGLEKERRQQQTALSEQSRCVRELTLEKQQLTAELEVQRMQLLGLTEDRDELKKLYGSESEEHEGVVRRLKTTLAELDQARSTLRTLEGADEHGMKVAMGMQQQITAQREHIDSLQGRIQLLEETMERLSQEKRRQSLESRHQIQELASAKEEKTQLAEELETLRSQDKRLRDKVAKLEAALHKMTESFSNCQDHIQTQEQEHVRLKLQHALDLKEQQGPSLRSTGSTAQQVSFSSLSALTALPFSTQRVSSKCLPELEPQKQEESPTMELRSLVKELRGVITENAGPHTPTTSPTSNRRRSTPDRVFTRTTLNEVTNMVTTGNDRMSKETYRIQPHQLRTSDLEERNERNITCDFSSESHDGSLATSLPRYTSSPRAAELGRRSPVHSLLTSSPSNTPSPQTRPVGSSILAVVSPRVVESTSCTCKDLHGKLDSLQNVVDDIQMRNQEISSMIKGEERRIRKVKDKERTIYNKPTNKMVL